MAHGPWPCPPSPGEASQPPAQQVAGEVLLGDAGLPAFPAVPEMGQVRQQRVPQDGLRGETGEQSVERLLRPRLIQPVQAVGQVLGRAGHVAATD
jgi:hypothetical protein